MAIPNQHRLDLSDPALRDKWGLRTDCTETNSVQTHFRRVRRQYRSRGELNALVLQTLTDSGRRLSRREIANNIGISKNWYLLDAIAELVALGRVREYESSWHGIPMFVYEVA